MRESSFIHFFRNLKRNISLHNWMHIIVLGPSIKHIHCMQTVLVWATQFCICRDINPFPEFNFEKLSNNVSFQSSWLIKIWTLQWASSWENYFSYYLQPPQLDKTVAQVWGTLQVFTFYHTVTTTSFSSWLGARFILHSLVSTWDYSHQGLPQGTTELHYI